jgi:hypothetical protein
VASMMAAAPRNWTLRRRPHHGLGPGILGARVLERGRLFRRRAHEAVLRVPPAPVVVRPVERRRQVRQAPQASVKLQVRRELRDPRDLDDGRGEGGYGGGEQVALVHVVLLAGVAPENEVVHLVGRGGKFTPSLKPDIAQFVILCPSLKSPSPPTHK